MNERVEHDVDLALRGSHVVGPSSICSCDRPSAHDSNWRGRLVVMPVIYYYVQIS